MNIAHLQMIYLYLPRKGHFSSVQTVEFPEATLVTWHPRPLLLDAEEISGWECSPRSPGPSDIETGIEWNRMRPEAKALLGKVGTQWLLFFMFLSYSSSRICWAPMWDHYGRKDWKEVLPV